MTPSPRQLEQTTHCDCGAVMLSVHGPIISMFQCACRNCQKVSGSGHASVVLLPIDAVCVDGETRSHDRPADSGATFTRHFCPHCGTTVHARSSRAPGMSIIPAGLFAGANDWFVPNQLIFARSRAGWDLLDEAMPWHATYREEQQR
jgi:hypothetical protein